MLRRIIQITAFLLLIVGATILFLMAYVSYGWYAIIPTWPLSFFSGIGLAWFLDNIYGE